MKGRNNHHGRIHTTTKCSHSVLLPSLFELRLSDVADRYLCRDLSEQRKVNKAFRIAGVPVGRDAILWSRLTSSALRPLPAS